MASLDLAVSSSAMDKPCWHPECSLVAQEWGSFCCGKCKKAYNCGFCLDDGTHGVWCTGERFQAVSAPKPDSATWVGASARYYLEPETYQDVYETTRTGNNNTAERDLELGPTPQTVGAHVHASRFRTIRLEIQIPNDITCTLL